MILAQNWTKTAKCSWRSPFKDAIHFHHDHPQLKAHFNYRRRFPCDCDVIDCDCLYPRWRHTQLCSWRLVSGLDIYYFMRTMMLSPCEYWWRWWWWRRWWWRRWWWRRWWWWWWWFATKGLNLAFSTILSVLLFFAVAGFPSPITWSGHSSRQFLLYAWYAFFFFR